MRRKNSDLKDSTTASHAAAWRQQLHSRLKEGVLIALGALCLYLWMALLTYDPADPSWSHSSQVDQVQNAAGRLGAVSADILFMTLGYFAYLFPLLLGIKTWQVFRRRNLPWEWNTWLFSWRLVGLIFLILAGSALAYIHFHASGHMPASASAGGAIGQSLGRVAVDALNVQGSTLVFFALFLFGLTVFADLSWFKVMDVTGKITLDFFELIQNAFNRWMGARAERKQLVAQLREVDERVAEVVAPSVPDRREQSKAKERLLEREEALAKHMSEREKRPPPKIDPPPPPKAPEPSKRVLKEKQAPLFVDTAVEGNPPPLRQMVRFSEVLSSPEYDEHKSTVPLALGHDIGGRPIITDLAKMPHLLVAGTTGSGKSVGVNAMLLSILFKSTPSEARLIMIDPKMLELSIYEGIPHLLCPVVTDMKEAANALRWSVAEMERRYRLMAAMGVRNLAGFNRKVKDAEEAGTPLTDPLFRRESPDDEPPQLSTLPTIVVVVDEFADMMMIVGKKVEELIARIAQKARAAGIHLILATQRPSVDVITGLIKANIPTRIAFQVSSKIDSRTILDQGGAEQLLGHGDMLYLPPGTGLPIRVHGAFVSDDEVHRVVEAWKLRGAPDYIEDILAGVDEGGGGGGSFDGGDGSGEGSEDDPLYDEAVRFVTESRRASISAVQRKLKIGYNRAARMIEAMEMAGVVTPMNTNGSREVIAPAPVRD